jgi:hypothetical protein
MLENRGANEMTLLFLLLLQIDPGYCGIGPFETGKYDPFWKSGACPRHDKMMTYQKQGELYESIWDTQSTFACDMAKTTAKEVSEGVYALIFGVPFALLGGIVGTVLQKRRQRVVKTSGSFTGQFED